MVGNLSNAWSPLLVCLGMVWLIMYDRHKMALSTPLEATWRKRRMLVAGLALLLFAVSVPLVLVDFGWILWAYIAISFSIGALAVTSLAIYAAKVAAKHTSAIR